MYEKGAHKMFLLHKFFYMRQAYSEMIYAAKNNFFLIEKSLSTCLYQKVEITIGKFPYFTKSLISYILLILK